MEAVYPHFDLSFVPLIAIANHHVEDCGQPPCLIDEPDKKRGRWSYFENQHGEQLIAVNDGDKLLVFHGDCGWDHPLKYDESQGALVGEDGPVTLNPAEELFFQACLLAWRAQSG